MANTDKQLEDWLRDAGPRVSASPERTDRVRRAVHNEWRTQLEAQRRKRRRRNSFAWAALAAAAVLVAAFAIRGVGGPGATPAVPEPIGEVAAVHGSVWVRPASADSSAPRAVLTRKDSIRTDSALITSADSQLALMLADGGSIRLSEDAVLRTLANRSFALDRGAIYVDSKRLDGSGTEPLEIVTPFGTTRNLGTQFEVRLQPDSLRVRVRAGRVIVSDGDETMEVGAAEQIEVGPGLNPIRRRIASDSVEWSWIARVVPTMDIEGRRLEEFLLWIARERGWRLDVERGGSAASTSTIELNGSIEGMTLDQALDSVMLTSRWTYRLEGDLLIVRPMDPARS